MSEPTRKSVAVVVRTVLACIVGGCAADSGLDSSGVIVVDSAGVDLIHYDRAGVEGVSRLGVEEVLRIGTRDGPEVTQFFRLSGAIERGGEIYLLDRGHSCSACLQCRRHVPQELRQGWRRSRRVQKAIGHRVSW